MDEEIRKGSSISMVLCIAWTIVPCVLSDADVHYDPKKPLCSVRKTLILVALRSIRKVAKASGSHQSRQQLIFISRVRERMQYW